MDVSSTVTDNQLSYTESSQVTVLLKMTALLFTSPIDSKPLSAFLAKQGVFFCTPTPRIGH